MPQFRSTYLALQCLCECAAFRSEYIQAGRANGEQQTRSTTYMACADMSMSVSELPARSLELGSVPNLPSLLMHYRCSVKLEPSRSPPLP